MEREIPEPGDGTHHPDSSRSEPRLLTIRSSVQELNTVRRLVAAGGTRIDQATALLLGSGYVSLAVVAALLAGRPSVAAVAVAVALAALYALGYRTEFASAAGSAVPTQPVLVGMLLTLPLSLVPLTVLLGLLIGGAATKAASTRLGAFAVCAFNGWHCVGPVVVLALAGDPPPSLAHWPIYVIALLSQFILDAAVALVRASGHGMSPRQLVGPLSFTFAIDTLLAPIGACVVIAAGRSPALVLLLAAPIGLVRLLARDRSEHLEAAVNLNTALVSVHEEARVDALTGLANRRAWEEALDQTSHGMETGMIDEVIVVAADLNFLKRANDTYGHEAGDALICAMGEVLLAAVPQALAVTRIGGDEYGVVIVRRAGHPDGEQVLADIRATMAAHPGVHGNEVSASLGVASCPPEPDVREAARVADARSAADKKDRRVARE